jgi:hypothetical protein
MSALDGVGFALALIQDQHAFETALQAAPNSLATQNAPLPRQSIMVSVPVISYVESSSIQGGTVYRWNVDGNKIETGFFPGKGTGINVALSSDQTQLKVDAVIDLDNQVGNSLKRFNYKQNSSVRFFEGQSHIPPNQGRAEIFKFRGASANDDLANAEKIPDSRRELRVDIMNSTDKNLYWDLSRDGPTVWTDDILNYPEDQAFTPGDENDYSPAGAGNKHSREESEDPQESSKRIDRGDTHSEFAL